MVIETPFLLVLLLRRVVMIIRPLELLDPERAPLGLWVSAAAMCSNLENSLSRNTAPAQTDDLTPPPLRSEVWKPHIFHMPHKSHACQCFVTSAYARKMTAAET